MATSAIPSHKICKDIYDRLVFDKEPGLRDRLFGIDSCRLHIFFENKHQDAIGYNLLEAGHYVHILEDLTNVRSIFLQDKIEEGSKVFRQVIDWDRFVVDLQIKDLVFGKMRDLVGMATLEAGEAAFFNSQIDPNKRKEALDYAIQAFQAHWSYGMLRDLEAQIVRGPPEQMYS